MGKKQAEKHFRLILWIIVLAALAVRILCALPALREGDECLRRIDSETYINPALALLQDGEYWTAPGSGIPKTQRPAGCALILTVIFAVFGKNYVIVSVLNCLASAATCYPIGLCGRLLGGRKAAYWAAGLFALNLTSLAQAPLILSDSILGLTCAWSLVYLLRSWRTKELSMFGISCILLALAAWIKPLTVPVLIGAMPLLSWMIFGFRRKTLYGLGLVLATCLVLIFPVMLRNYRCGSEFDMDSNRGIMLFHSGAAILGAETGEDTGELRERMARETNAYLDAHPELYPNRRARNNYCQKKYLELILEHPRGFFLTHMPQWTMLLPDLPTFLENNRLTTTGRGTLDVMRKSGVYAALKHYLDGRLGLVVPVIPFVLITGLLYLGSAMLLIIWLYHWKSQWNLLIFFGVFAFFYLFAGGPVVMPRYQIPALPLLCAMAGTWFILLFRKKQTVKS